MEDFQGRVIEEKDDLDRKAVKLSDFIDSPDYLRLPDADRGLLQAQLALMVAYSDILQSRINCFQ